MTHRLGVREMECRRPSALHLLSSALFLLAASASAASAQAPAAPAKPPVIAPAATTPKKVLLPARGVPAAVAPVPTLVVKPPAELDGVRFLLGKWRCDGKQFASATFGPEHVFKASAEMKTAVDGAWFQFLYEEKGARDHVGVKVHALWGWDQAAKRLIRSAVSSDGAWDSATAPGLEGDKVVWLGDFSLAAGRLPFRHTFTRKSDKEWTHVMELKDPSGRWVSISDVNCKR